MTKLIERFFQRKVVCEFFRMFDYYCIEKFWDAEEKEIEDFWLSLSSRIEKLYYKFGLGVYGDIDEYF